MTTFQCTYWPEAGGHQFMIQYDNGFGLSVVNHKTAYCTLGADSFEIALLFDGQLVYTSDFPDVIGWQSLAEVMEVGKWAEGLDFSIQFSNSTYPEF